MRKLVYLFTIFLIALSCYRLIDSFLQWSRIKKIEVSYANELRKLKVERESLKGQTESLKSDRFLQESLAREIGYRKPGETMYIIVRGKGDENGFYR